MDRRIHRWFLVLGIGFAGAMSMGPVRAQQVCGGTSYPFPYTDVAGVTDPFCPGIMEAYVSGISKGTTPTQVPSTLPVLASTWTTFPPFSATQMLSPSAAQPSG
jgi:hypothetical protein